MSKGLLDAFIFALDIVERGVPMPECCDEYDMLEIEGSSINTAGETEVVGYRCSICGREVDLNGRTTKEGKENAHKGN